MKLFLKITRPFRIFANNIVRIIKWIPIIWQDRDWDYQYLYDVLKFKMSNMINYIKKYSHTAEPENTNIINSMIEVRDLINKIQTFDYSKESLKQIGFYNKYPDFQLKMDFVKEPNEDGYYTAKFNLEEGSEKEKLYNSHYELKAKLENDDIHKLFELMATNIRNWWD